MSKISWFKKVWLNSEERKALENMYQEQEKCKDDLEGETVYKTMIHTDNQYLTVILKSGLVLSKTDADSHFVSQVKKCVTEGEIRVLFSQVPDPEMEEIVPFTRIFEENSEFSVFNSVVYLKGCKLLLPKEVIYSFVEILEKIKLYGKTEKLVEAFNSLKFFWLKLATNPLESCRDSVLLFCKNNDIRLSPTGNIIGYRRIVTWEDPKVVALNDFVTFNYERLKRWKKGTNVEVYFDGTNYGFDFTSANHYVGVLSDLYLNKAQSTEQYYTSWHNSGKYIFKIGDVYKMKEEEPDPNVGNCHSGGIHASSCQFDYSGFGDTPVVILINPSKTIFTPTHDSKKFRTSEMKIACINPNEHGVHIDEELIREADLEYNEYTIQELEEVVQTKSFDILAVQEEAPELTIRDIKEIASILKNRVKQV